MARGGQVEAVAIAPEARMRGWRGSGLRAAVVLARIDQTRAGGEIVPVDESCEGHGDEIAVREITVAIGVGKAPGLEEEVQARARHRLQAAKVEALELAEDRQHGRSAGTRRTHAANPIAAVLTADRWPRLRL